MYSQNGSWRARPDSRLRGNDVMRDGNGSWGAQNERGRHGQNIPKTAVPLSYAKVSLRGNDVMRDGNGG